MPFGGFAGAIGGALLGSVGSIISGNRASSSNARQAALDRQFQKEVYQNQLQWKAADAKKAGLHPLSVIGTGSYSPSPSSVPSSGYSGLSDSLGKLGEGIGDAFHAYMTKDERAAAVAAQQDKIERDKRQDDANLRLTEAQIQNVSAQAMATARRALGVNRPWANGREYMPGQVDSGSPSLLGGKVGDTYAVRPIGNEQYDINFSPAYQGEIGDELGQLVNALKAYTRSGGNLLYALNPSEKKERYGNFWRNPETGEVYRFDRKTGYWDRMRWRE